MMPSPFRHLLSLSARFALGMLLSAPLALPVAATSIDYVPVGNPGNAPDQYYGPAQFGNVAYHYGIGKYEVTNSQYVEFLNAVDPTGANQLQLYDPFMTSDPQGSNGGINYLPGNSNGTKFAAILGRGDKPVVWVSWYDAVRFANWMHNGQGAGDTETGSYTLLGGTANPTNGLSVVRNPGATWVLPNENEWYKSAYYEPAATGGDVDDYWLYPTRSNSDPYSDQPPGSQAPTTSNTANFFRDDGQVNGYNDGFAVTGAVGYSTAQNYLTDRGAYASAVGPWGTFDQGGNVSEWNETLIGNVRFIRGGSFQNFAFTLSAPDRGPTGDPFLSPNGGLGFRLALVPEPSTVVLAAFGIVGLATASALARWNSASRAVHYESRIRFAGSISQDNVPR